MNKNEWSTMNDSAFEELLKTSAFETLSEEIVADITPWRKSIRRILLGMILSTITLNFWGFNYILPAIGMIFSILGFRTLQKENKWFRGCYIISIIRGSYHISTLILNTTIYDSDPHILRSSSVLSVIYIGLLFILIIFFRNALRAVQQKAGLSPNTGHVVTLLFWYAIVCALSLIQYLHFIILSAMLLGYIFIIRRLYKLSNDIEEAGYVIQTTPIRLSDHIIVSGITAILTIGCICGYLFGGSYHMTWTPLDTNEHNEVKEIKSELTALGFPEDILNDMSAKDIAACEGALQVLIQVRNHSLNSDHVVKTNEYMESFDHIKDLRITGIGVRLPDEHEAWLIIHHFEWTANPEFYGTESIQLWPAYYTTRFGWNKSGEITGRLLYNDNGISYTSPYHSLNEQTYTASNLFFHNEKNVTEPFATFSFPNSGEKHRGYVAYRIIRNMNGSITDSWFNYTHQKSRFQYPVLTAMEHRMSKKWEIHSAFQTIQDALQFYSKDDGAELY